MLSPFSNRKRWNPLRCCNALVRDSAAFCADGDDLRSFSPCSARFSASATAAETRSLVSVATMTSNRFGSRSVSRSKSYSEFHLTQGQPVRPPSLIRSGTRQARLVALGNPLVYSDSAPSRARPVRGKGRAHLPRLRGSQHDLFLPVMRTSGVQEGGRMSSPTPPRPARTLPATPSLEQQKKQARELLDAVRAGDAVAFRRFQANHPQCGAHSKHELRAHKFSLHQAQLVIA